MKYCPLCKAELLAQVHEGKSRLSCSSYDCDYVFWNSPTPVVLAIVNYQGQYVITNNAAWPEWKYSLISGFVDANEDSQKAIEREVYEELRLESTSTTLITVSLFERLNQLMISYYVEAQGELILNSENRAFKLLNEEEIIHWSFGLGATPAVQKWFVEK
ncbi:hypothetical protein MNBD_GAMMA12-2746 [hydrothermal vent metagenome]|uniref:Nudix hydrolase domain-containing protein n=1 Tax=hydrothermal vent metagenome TaxID=652676 RepID=A0A3B0YEM2_9ZZZZ